MTPEEQKQWEDAYAQIIAYDKEEHQKKLKCLEFVKQQVSKEMYEDILHYIQECDQTEGFEITSKEPSSECLQTESGYECLKEAWVDQYTNGGYTGDHYEGCVHLKINQSEYLKFHYSM